MEKQKNIDILKGLGIIFVVMGHSGGYGSGSLSGYIYSFHMPLFFFISGYLLKIDKKPIDFIKRKITTILIPYTLFFAFSFIWINTVYATIHKAPIFSFPFEKIDFFKALILSGGYLEKIPLNNFPLWFLPHLFIALIISYGILKIRYIVIRTSCIIFLIMVSVPFQQWVHLYGGGRPAYHIDALPVAITYIVLGFYFKKLVLLIQKKMSNEVIKKYVWSESFIFLGYFLSLFYNGTINNINTYGYFLTATMSIIGYYSLATKIDSNVLQYLGQKSLYIFAFHALVPWELCEKMIAFLESKHQSGILIFVVVITLIISFSLILTVLVINIKRMGVYGFNKILSSKK